MQSLHLTKMEKNLKNFFISSNDNNILKTNTFSQKLKWKKKNLTQNKDKFLYSIIKDIHKSTPLKKNIANVLNVLFEKPYDYLYSYLKSPNFISKLNEKENKKIFLKCKLKKIIYFLFDINSLNQLQKQKLNKSLKKILNIF